MKDREIKFRAWDKDAEKMTVSMTLKEIIRQAHPFRKMQEDELVWMEFTGLLDKNGKEIYEGDIVHRYGKVELVEMKEINDDYDSYFGYNNYNDGETEIIGNIYENPELLTPKA